MTINQTAKSGAFSRQKFGRALREHGSALIGSSFCTLMASICFDSYKKHGNKILLVGGWVFVVFFVWVVSFIVGKIICASRHDEAEISAAPGISTEG